MKKTMRRRRSLALRTWSIEVLNHSLMSTQWIVGIVILELTCTSQLTVNSSTILSCVFVMSVGTLYEPRAEDISVSGVHVCALTFV